MDVGPFSVTQPNPTHDFTDPTQPNPRMNPTHGHVRLNLWKDIKSANVKECIQLYCVTIYTTVRSVRQDNAK